MMVISEQRFPRLSSRSLSCLSSALSLGRVELRERRIVLNIVWSRSVTCLHVLICICSALVSPVEATNCTRACVQYYAPYYQGAALKLDKAWSLSDQTGAEVNEPF